MNKTKYRIINLILSSIIIITLINIVSPYFTDAIIYVGATTTINGTHIVKYGKQMLLEGGEVATPSDSSICKIEGNVIRVIGVGSFSIKSNKSSSTEQFFAWNAKLLSGSYYVYADSNIQGDPVGVLKAPCYLATEVSSNGKALKIKEAFGQTYQSVENTYISNFYDASSQKSRSVYFEYSFTEENVLTNEMPNVVIDVEPNVTNTNKYSNNTNNNNKINNNTNNNTSPQNTVNNNTSGNQGQNSNTKLKVHFIDPNSRVDAIYIEFGDVNFYIDGGFPWDTKKEIEYLNRIGVKQIDYYIGSHSHKNHVGAAAELLYKYNIKTVIMNGAKTNGEYSVKKAILQHSTKTAWTNYAKNCKWVVVEHGDDLNKKLGLTSLPLKIKCIGPTSYVKASIGDTSQNKNSMVLNFTYKDASFLFTGDLSSHKPLDSVINTYPSLCKVDVLKNPHHDGKQSKDRYKKFNMKYIVYCTKDGDVPGSSQLSEVKSIGATPYIITTKRDKSVLMTTDGKTITVKTKN